MSELCVTHININALDEFVTCTLLQSTYLEAETTKQRNTSLLRKVTSWDEGKGTVDTHHEDGRSYISAVSEVMYDREQLCNGTAKVMRRT